MTITEYLPSTTPAEIGWPQSATQPGHAKYCPDKHVSAQEHGCFSDTEDVPAFGGLEVDHDLDRRVPTATAQAYQAEPEAPGWVLLHGFDEKYDGEVRLLFHAASARQLAAQLLKASDLIDGPTVTA